MANLNELEEYDPEDEVMEFAITREFELRERRYALAKEGLNGVVVRVTASIEKFREAFAGIDG